MKRLVIVILFVSVLCTCGKNSNSLIAGGATETVNARVMISDTIVTVCVKSDTAVGVRIILSSTAYNPVYHTGYIDSAILSGQDLRSEFPVVPGMYNVMIVEQNLKKSVAFMSINVTTSQQDTLTDSLSVGKDLKGMVVLPPDVDLKVDKAAVYFEGTVLSEVLTTPDFSFANIPNGKYRLTAWVSNTVENGIKSLPLTVSRQVDIEGEKSLDDIQLIFSR
jgi:hypothetical protein